MPVPLPEAWNTWDPLQAPGSEQRDSPSLIFSVLQLSLLLPGDLAHASAHKDPWRMLNTPSATPQSGMACTAHSAPFLLPSFFFPTPPLRDWPHFDNKNTFPRRSICWHFSEWLLQSQWCQQGTDRPAKTPAIEDAGATLFQWRESINGLASCLRFKDLGWGLQKVLSVDSARCGWDTSHYHLSKSCVFMVIDLFNRKSAPEEKSPKLWGSTEKHKEDS